MRRPVTGFIVLNWYLSCSTKVTSSGFSSAESPFGTGGAFTAAAAAAAVAVHVRRQGRYKRQRAAQARAQSLNE